MEFAVPVRWGSSEAGREGALGQEERAACVFARGLDEDLRRASIVVLALAGAIEDRIHGADCTARLPLSRAGATLARLPLAQRSNPSLVIVEPDSEVSEG